MPGPQIAPIQSDDKTKLSSLSTEVGKNTSSAVPWLCLREKKARLEFIKN